MTKRPESLTVLNLTTHDTPFWCRLYSSLSRWATTLSELEMYSMSENNRGQKSLHVRISASTQSKTSTCESPVACIPR